MTPRLVAGIELQDNQEISPLSKWLLDKNWQLFIAIDDEPVLHADKNEVQLTFGTDDPQVDACAMQAVLSEVLRQIVVAPLVAEPGKTLSVVNALKGRNQRTMA